MEFESIYISQKAQELISSGIPSLDAVLGGGIPKGSLVLLNEDTLGTYSDMFLKVFLSQGVVKKDDVLFASCDTSPDTFMRKLPQETNSVTPAKICSNEPLQIAWRYERNPLVNSSLDASATTFSNNFHFKDTLSEELLQSTNIYCWPFQGPSGTYEELIEFIHNKLSINNHLDHQTSKRTNKSISRIGIHNLGSFFWKQSQNTLPQFFYKLRALIHHSQAVALITFPKYLIKELEVASRCEQMCDSVMELESFGADVNPLYSELNGFIKFNKLAVLNSLCPLMKDSKDWAFKLSLKKLIIEKVRLPPESESSGQREQDVTSGCYSQTNNKLDF